MKTVLADYLTIHGATKLSRQIEEKHPSLVIAEGTLRDWAYYKDRTPKPRIVVTKHGKFDDILTLGESLIEKRLAKLDE